MMTIDDEGEGGVLPMMTSSQKSQIFGKFLDFTGNFSKIFQKNIQNQDKNFQLFKEIFPKNNAILFLWHHIKG